MLESELHSEDANGCGQCDYQKEAALITQGPEHSGSKDWHFCLPHSGQSRLSVLLLHLLGQADPKEAKATNPPILLVTSLIS